MSAHMAAGAWQQGYASCCYHLAAQVTSAGTMQPRALPHSFASQAEHRFPGLELFSLKPASEYT